MHFYYIPAYGTYPYLAPITKQDCFDCKLGRSTCLYEPSQEVDEFIGTCLILGVPITFIKIDTSIEIPENNSVFILSSCEPMVATTLTGRLITLYPSTSYLSSDEGL